MILEWLVIIWLVQKLRGYNWIRADKFPRLKRLN
jgi:hypothetical protein